MGRTLPSATMVFDGEAARWGKFRRALRREDQEVFDTLFLAARRHIAAWMDPANPGRVESRFPAMRLEAFRNTGLLEERIRALAAARPPVVAPDP